MVAAVAEHASVAVADKVVVADGLHSTLADGELQLIVGASGRMSTMKLHEQVCAAESVPTQLTVWLPQPKLPENDDGAG
jgi:hypothetical protein